MMDSYTRKSPPLAARFALSMLVCMGPGRLASPASNFVAQDRGAASSREQAGLVEEQELLARKLARIVASMERLAGQYEAEGRVHGATLLREGLAHIAKRSEASGITLRERMDGTRSSLDAGQSMQSIEFQENIVRELEALVSILMDRPDLEELENELQRLEQRREALENMASAEEEIREKTGELREQVANDAQEQLEQRIEQARQEQRELLGSNEQLSREAGSIDLERLEQALTELLAAQDRDTQVLMDWDPAQIPALEALAKQLQAAQLQQARAARLADAAKLMETPGASNDPGQRARDLESAAEAAERAARASGDASAKSAAENLEKAAVQLREAGPEKNQQAAAEAAVKALADELQAQAEEFRKQADAARAQAIQALKELNKKSRGLTQELAGELAKSLEGMPPGKPDSLGNQKLSDAADKVREALEQAKFLGQAMQASQERNASQAQALKDDVERLPQDLGEEGQLAQSALEQASRAMQSAADESQQQQAQAASQSASKAQEALREAQQALAKARQRKATQGDAAARQQSSELNQAQEQLANEVREMGELVEQASLSEEAQGEVEQALEQAAQSMEQATREMQQGLRSSAARSQRAAGESLGEAGRKAQAGVVPQTDEQKQTAEELAQDQEAIEKALYEFKKEQDEQGPDSPKLESLEDAQASAKQAKQSLEQGQLDDAQKQAKQAKKEIQQAIDDLKEKEEQYQKLRNEELLFRIAEEITAVQGPHKKLMADTREIDRGRKAGAKATRGQKLRLRKYSRAEGTLGRRVGELHKAIKDENSLVFAELLSRVQKDLERIEHLLGESGGYRSGDRVQALQEDVARDLVWLAASLAEEQDRREEESQQGQDSPESESVNRLVPDVAELKLLSQMELDVLDNIEELLVIYPELGDAQAIDPLLLEEIQRLGHRHERTTELFRQFRQRLGIETGPPADHGTDEKDDTTPEGPQETEQ